ncbi:MAG TPA: phospholipase D family protein [Humibacillus xanthopallidus]|nr:phospholipase D family protein [Humibacillus xanthopallidus]
MVTTPWLDSIDATAGDGIEGVLRSRHRRRLRRLGWSDVLDPARGQASPAGTDPGPWWSRHGSVRPGNSVEVLVDGAAALPEIERAIRSARHHVHIAGWHATPGFRLTRDPGAPSLRDLLAETAERVPVRLLLWAGPPLPLFQPTRPMVSRAREEFIRGGRVVCALDKREYTMHCHHEKIVVVDDDVAFVGGIDLTDLQGDRYDHEAHHPRMPLGWHDAAVRLRGPVVADVARHFQRRWGECTGEQLPTLEQPGPAGDVEVQLLRTVPDGVYDFASRGEFTILEAYLRALGAAQRFIYLENQFLWSPEVVDVLASKLTDPPHPDFRVLLVLPARPNNGADTTRGQLGRLLTADGGSGRLLATTIGAHDGGEQAPIYVHAKIGIVDDQWLTIGSANLNEHSLFNDTEVNLLVCDAALARATRLRLWSEHTERPVEQIDGDPHTVIDETWQPIAREQARRARAGQPRTHRLQLLDSVSRRTDRLQGPVRGLLVDG